jgi:hypothetical protein
LAKEQYRPLNDMATSSSSTAVPTSQEHEGTFEYPEHLPDSPAIQATYLYRMVRETLNISRRTQEAIYDLDQWVRNLEKRGEELNGRLMAIRALQENQQIGLREIHKALYPPQGKGKAKAEPLPGPSKPTEAKKEPGRTPRHSSFAYSVTSAGSSRSNSPIRTGFSFRTSIPPQSSSTPLAATPHPVPKLSSPDPYDGKKKGRPARQWLARILAWVELSRAAFPDERALILYMLHLLKDNAANWAQPHLQKVLNHRRGAIAMVDEFIDEFGSAFDDPDAGRAAERKILELTQESTTTRSTAEYTTEFRNLMADLDWDDTALIASYRRGLHWKVRELMSQRETQPRNLEGWITVATQIDNIRQENEASCPPHPSTTSKKVTVTTPAPVTVKRDPKALPNYVDEAERKRRREAGLCIKCGGAGHTIKDCKVGWKPVKAKEEKGKVAEEEVKLEDSESGKE